VDRYRAEHALISPAPALRCLAVGMTHESRLHE